MDHKEEYQKTFEPAKKGLPIDKVSPELKETKGERIRRCLLVWIKNSDYTGIAGIPKDDVISWLENQKEYVSNNFDEVWEREDCSEILAEGEKLTPEFKALFKKVCHAFFDKGVELTKKQKEQKPVKRPKFKIGDVVKFKGFGDEPANDTPLKIVGYDNELYLFDNGTTDLFSEQDLYELVEQKPVEKSSMLKKLKEHLANTLKEQLDAEFEALKHLTIDEPAEWSGKDKECRDELIQYIEQRIGDGTTGQYLWKKWHSWLNSLPERFNLSSEQKWSEKDKDMLLSAIEYIQTYPAHRQSVVTWLKFLPERFNLQSQWKPSEEQIEALEWMLTTVSFKDGGYGVVLKNLIDDLKKQM